MLLNESRACKLSARTVSVRPIGSKVVAIESHLKLFRRQEHFMEEEEVSNLYRSLICIVLILKYVAANRRAR